MFRDRLSVDVDRRVALSIAASVALSLAGAATTANADPYVIDDPAVSLPPAEQPQQPVAIPTVPDIKCTPDSKMLFYLASPHNVKPGQTVPFRLTARGCKDSSPNLFKDVKIVESDSHGKRKVWNTKNLAPGSNRHKNFTINLQAGHQDMTFKAFAKGGKRIGLNNWDINLPTATDPEVHAALPSTPATVPLNCIPNPDTKIGISDDAEIVFEQLESREEALQQGRDIFGATLLRINMIYGEVQKYGYQPYIDAVNAARAYGYEVQITIMPTPSYKPQLDQALSYVNYNPQVAADFATKIATTFGDEVQFYEIFNEINNQAFNNDRSLAKYRPVFVAARTAILAVDPSAKIITAGLAHTSDVESLLASMRELAGGEDDIAYHPYGSGINNLYQSTIDAGQPLNLTEYGNQVSDPNQLTDDRQAIALARCAGAKSIILYQIKRNDSPWWDSGVVPR